MAHFKRNIRNRKRAWRKDIKKYGSYETLNWFDPYPAVDLYKNKAKYYRRFWKIRRESCKQLNMF